MAKRRVTQFKIGRVDYVLASSAYLLYESLKDICQRECHNGNIKAYKFSKVQHNRFLMAHWYVMSQIECKLANKVVTLIQIVVSTLAQLC